MNSNNISNNLDKLFQMLLTAQSFSAARQQKIYPSKYKKGAQQQKLQRTTITWSGTIKPGIKEFKFAWN